MHRKNARRMPRKNIMGGHDYSLEPESRPSREDTNANRLYNALIDGDTEKAGAVLSELGFVEPVIFSPAVIAEEEKRCRSSGCEEAAENSLYYMSLSNNVVLGRVQRRDGVNTFVAYAVFDDKMLFLRDTFYKYPLRNLRLFESVAAAIDHYDKCISPLMRARHINMSYDADAIGDVAIIHEYGPRICIADPTDYKNCMDILRAIDAPPEAINYMLKERDFFHLAGIGIQ